MCPAKQVAMMAYCQVKASKAKVNEAQLARQNDVSKTVPKGRVAQMIALE